MGDFITPPPTQLEDQLARGTQLLPSPQAASEPAPSSTEAPEYHIKQRRAQALHTLNNAGATGISSCLEKQSINVTDPAPECKRAVKKRLFVRHDFVRPLPASWRYLDVLTCGRFTKPADAPHASRNCCCAQRGTWWKLYNRRIFLPEWRNSAAVNFIATGDAASEQEYDFRRLHDQAIITLVVGYTVLIGLGFGLYYQYKAHASTDDETHNVSKMLWSAWFNSDQYFPAVLTSIICAFSTVAIFLTMHYLRARAPLVIGTHHDEDPLPTLLSSVLQPRAHEFMVSYKWDTPPHDLLIRGLATMLPDCWFDMERLAGGDKITSEITHAIAHCRCAIIALSDGYLTSNNCCCELSAAVLHRRPDLHQTVVIMLPNTNPDTNANTNSDTNANTNPNTNANTNSDTNANTNSDTNPDTNANTNSDTNANTNSDTNANTNPDTNANTNSDTNANTTQKGKVEPPPPDWRTIRHVLEKDCDFTVVDSWEELLQFLQRNVTGISSANVEKDTMHSDAIPRVVNWWSAYGTPKDTPADVRYGWQTVIHKRFSERSFSWEHLKEPFARIFVWCRRVPKDSITSGNFGQWLSSDGRTIYPYYPITSTVIMWPLVVMLVVAVFVSMCGCWNASGIKPSVGMVCLTVHQMATTLLCLWTLAMRANSMFPRKTSLHTPALLPYYAARTWSLLQSGRLTSARKVKIVFAMPTEDPHMKEIFSKIKKFLREAVDEVALVRRDANAAARRAGRLRVEPDVESAVVHSNDMYAVNPIDDVMRSPVVDPFTIYVLALTTERAEIAWSEAMRSSNGTRWPPHQTVLLATHKGKDEPVSRHRRHLFDYMYFPITNGSLKDKSYDGTAAAIIDAVAAKIGNVLVTKV